MAGAMSPRDAAELSEFRTMFEKATTQVSGTLYLNVKRLVRLNNIAFHELARFVTKACTDKPDLKISVVTSSVVGWSARKFAKLAHISPNISVEQYDKDFYPGQGVLEDGGFIPILRTQTKLTWRHERDILPRHGMKPGLAVADICCGIGDFAALLFKEFNPSRLVAVDHAKPSLAYARKVAADFGIKGIEYVYGDASSLLIDDNQFDFVTGRN